jgi:hypothetical protein
MQAAARQGLNLVPGGGFSLDDPGTIAHLGIQAVIPLMRRVKEMLGPVDFFLNFVEIVIFLLAALVVIVSFCILAIQVFLAFLEYRLLSLAAYLAIPFAVLGPTSFVAERAIGYIAASALKLLVLGCVIAMCSATLLALTFSGTPTLAQAFGVAVLSAAIFVLAIKAPRAAAGLVNGDPKTGATAFTVVWTETVYRDFKPRSRALMSAAVVTVDGPSRDGALDGVSVSGFSEPSGTPLTPAPKEPRQGRRPVPQHPTADCVPRLGVLEPAFAVMPAFPGRAESGMPGLAQGGASGHRQPAVHGGCGRSHCRLCRTVKAPGAFLILSAAIKLHGLNIHAPSGRNCAPVLIWILMW